MDQEPTMPYEPMISDIEATALIAETEREILNDALGVDSPEDDMPSDLIADQSRVEGWTGALDDSELLHTTAYGHEQHGFDRPLAYREEADAITENEQLRQQLAERDQELLQLLDQAGPVRESRERMQEQRREALLNAAMDPAQADQVLGTLEGQQAQLHANNMDRANAALEAAHARYGRDFERVYTQVQNMDPRNPLTNQIVQSLFASRDPGEALMSLSGNPLLQTLSSGRPPPPFMPGSRSTSGGARQSGEVGYRDLEDLPDPVTAEMESDIFQAATRR
jgi:hypothetical protein